MNMPFQPQGGAPVAAPQQPAAMPQPNRGLVAELDDRLRNLGPQGLQELEMLLTQSDPRMLQLLGQIFPELQQALQVILQMQQGAGGQPQQRNPLSADNGGVSPGLVGAY